MLLGVIVSFAKGSSEQKRKGVSAQNKLVSFYAGLAPDNQGRFLKEIQNWSDERLERTHDYIQWLFPLTGGARSILACQCWTRTLSMNSTPGLSSVAAEEPRSYGCSASTVSRWLTIRCALFLPNHLSSVRETGSVNRIIIIYESRVF
jgi:Opioid growth factor receptor (OGFr) conserved region